jgi:hypothetical protein
LVLLEYGMNAYDNSNQELLKKDEIVASGLPLISADTIRILNKIDNIFIEKKVSL